MNKILLITLFGLIAITAAAPSEDSQESQVNLPDSEIYLAREQRNANPGAKERKQMKRNKNKGKKKLKHKRKGQAMKNHKNRKNKSVKRGKNKRKNSNNKTNKNKNGKQKKNLNKEKKRNKMGRNNKKRNLKQSKLKKVLKTNKSKKITNKDKKEKKQTSKNNRKKIKKDRKVKQQNKENKGKKDKSKKALKSDILKKETKANNARATSSDSSGSIRNNRKKKPVGNRSGSINNTCFEAAISHMKIAKDRVTNFLKQEARMKNFNKTAGKKKDKKGLFAPIANKIIDVGGGNASNLSCGGTYGNSGAANMTRILTTLQACETKVATACDPSAYPLPENMTKVTECSSTMKTYKTAVTKCIKKSGDEACSCWLDANLTAMAEVIKTCDVKDENAKVTTQHKLCSGNFSTCKSTEDEAGEYVFTCSQTAAELTAKAAQVKANKESLESAKTAISQLSGNSTSNSTSNSTVKKGLFRQSLSTCAAVIEASTELLSYASQMISSNLLTALAKKIAAATGVACSTAEKADLSGQVSSYTVVIVQATSVLSTFTSSVSDSSGSAPTDAELDAALTNSTTNGTTNEESSSTQGSGSGTTAAGGKNSTGGTGTAAGTTEDSAGTTGDSAGTTGDSAGTTAAGTSTGGATKKPAGSTQGKTTEANKDGSTSDMETTKGSEETETTMLSPVSMGSVSVDSTGSMIPMTSDKPESTMEPMSSTGSEGPMTSVDSTGSMVPMTSKTSESTLGPISSMGPMSSMESSSSMGPSSSIGSTNSMELTSGMSSTSSMGSANSIGSANSMSSSSSTPMSTPAQITTSRPNRKFAIRNLAKNLK